MKNQLEKTNYRQKGKQIEGKIVKGFIQDAASKISVGSIPSKFETIIYKNYNTKAFGCSSTRFFEIENEKPGPGQYIEQSLKSNSIEQSTSISKKGLGNGFVSSSQRNAFGYQYINNGPGPGSYASKEKSELLEKRTQNFKGSSMFLAQSRNTKSQDIQRVVVEPPGPGEYNAKLMGSTNPYFSSFISATKRDKYLGLSETPAPGQYNIRRNITKKQIFPHKAYMSSFCQPVEKKQHSQNQMKDLAKYIDTDNQKQAVSPGPCDYNNNQPDLKPEYLISQPNSIFKDGLKDRFGDFYDPDREKKPLPGPNVYTIENITGLNRHQSEKALVSGSAFMSETIRKPYGQFEKKLGPNSIIPYLGPKKKTYHLNLSRKFV